MRTPTAAEQSLIATEAAKGSDALLPAQDRRSRAQISPTMSLAVGSHVFVGTDEYMVLGPGRKEGWALLAWIDDSTARCYGTFHESQITVVQKAILLSGQSNAVRCVAPNLTAYGVYVVKAARDSSSITRWLAGGSERSSLFAAVAGMDVQEYWQILGEEDSLVEADATAFNGRLVTHVADVRTTLSKPQLPVRVGLVNSALARTYAATVRAAQIAVCADDPYAYPFDMDTIPGYDGLHYSNAGNIAVGQGFGADYISTQ